MPNQNRRRKTKFRVRAGAAFRVPIPIRRINFDISYLKSLVNAELHEVTSSFSAGTISDIGGITNLTNISQGDTNANRTGNSCLVRWINGQLCISQTSADVDAIRLIVFVWKGVAAPNVSDVLETVSPFAHLNKKVTGNFRDAKVRVLYNRLIAFSQIDQSVKIIRFNVDMNPMNSREKAHTLYDAGGSTPVNKGVYFLRLGTQAVNKANISGKIKLNFYDN